MGVEKLYLTIDGPFRAYFGNRPVYRLFRNRDAAQRYADEVGEDESRQQMVTVKELEVEEDS